MDILGSDIDNAYDTNIVDPNILHSDDNIAILYQYYLHTYIATYYMCG